MAIGASYEVGRRTHLGGLLRAFFIPWSGNEEKPLTTEFIGEQTIVGFGLSVTLSFDANWESNARRALNCSKRMEFVAASLEESDR